MNRVLFALMLIGIAAGLLGGFVAEAPNRLVSGTPISLWQAAGPGFTAAIAGGAAALLALAFTNWHGVALIVASALLLLVILAAGTGAETLSQGLPSAARISLGWAFWVMALVALFAIIDAVQRLNLSPLARLAVAILVAAAIAVPLSAGMLGKLSILREFAVRKAVFVSEMSRHIELVLGALIPALIVGVALGLWASRRARVRIPLFTTLNLLQTIPSVALFGLLIGPLSLVGLGVGATPAVIALVLYALLPVARNSAAALEAADPAIVEAARGMGFTPRQIFWRAQIPLGLPVFLAGLRIVLVQTIGLAVIAALIGGGGLGSFIFQGIGQYAIDLVLLGAIPVTLLALAADFLLRLAVASVESRA